MTCAKLGLGTVQFGIDYGVSNSNGQVAPDEVARILTLARDAGIRTLDTASAYGESESVLGELLADKDSFEIVTKTVSLGRDRVGDEELEHLRAGFQSSLNRLRRTSVNTLLVHNANDLLVPGGERVYEQLCSWRDAGAVERIGISAYDAAQVEAVFARYDFSVVQLPVSVMDQRLIRTGTISALLNQGVAVHARSIFLQGLLLLDGRRLPTQLAAWHPRLEKYRSFLEAQGVTATEAAIGFVRSLPGLEVILVGVLSRGQLEECVAAYDAARVLDLSEFACDDPDLVDPRRWPSRC